jgi:mannosyltransferase OCH1-like enzyme
MIIIEPRNQFIIQEKYELIQHAKKKKKISSIQKVRQRFLNPYDVYEKFFICVVYYLSDYLINVKITRMDQNQGWEEDLKLLLDDHEIIDIGSHFLYQFNKQFKTQTRVSPALYKNFSHLPKTIIQTGFISNDMNYQKCLDSFLDFNPDYKYIFYEDKDCITFFQDYYPDYLEYYLKLRPGAFRSDFFRYCYLYTFGGFYFDHKMICRVSLDRFVSEDSHAILCADWDFNQNLKTMDRIYNAMIIIKKNHLLMAQAISKCVYNIKNEIYGCGEFDITGPSLLYSCYIDHRDVVVKFKHICYEPYLLLLNCPVIDIDSKQVIMNKTHDYIKNPKSGEYHKMYALKQVYHEIARLNDGSFLVIPKQSFEPCLLVKTNEIININDRDELTNILKDRIISKK